MKKQNFPANVPQIQSVVKHYGLKKCFKQQWLRKKYFSVKTRDDNYKRGKDLRVRCVIKLMVLVKRALNHQEFKPFCR